MPSTYSSNLRLQLMETGQNTGQWGNITNINLGQVLEQALTYQSNVAVLDSAIPTDLTSVDGTATGDTARSLYINLTGALTATRTVRTPQYKHFYIVGNATTGAQSVTFTSTAVSSVGVTIPNGAKALLYCDGTDVISAATYFPSLVNSAITGGSINNTTIGATTPSSGIFTNGSAATWNITSGGTLTNVTLAGAGGSLSGAAITGSTINSTTIGATSPSTGVFTSLSSTSGAFNGTIGATTPNNGAFSALSSTGVYTNTVVDGSMPMAITSTTRVSNLNVARAGYSDTSTVVDDTTTASSFYPMFAGAVSGQQALKGSSTKWTFNPSTGAMVLSGAFSPTTLTPTNPLGTAYGGTGNALGVLNPRVTAVSSGGTITPDANTTDMVTQANTASAGTLTIAAPTGTPVNGQKLLIRITCTNAQTLSFNAIYRSSSDLGFPASTTGSTKTDYLGFVYNTSATKWDMLAKVFGF